VSPAPSRTSLPAIVAAAGELLEEVGLEGLTMQSVAERVGVRAPSLYKHVRDRAALVQAVGDDIMRSFGEELRAAMGAGDPADDLRGLARAYREFAHRHPVGQALAFSNVAEYRPSPELNRQASEPILRVAEALVGPEHALEAARTLTAFAYGFVSMELSGAFRLGGSVDEAYRYGVDAIAAALIVQRRGSGPGV
jgi:AcrR family transcriptional regulator